MSRVEEIKQYWEEQAVLARDGESRLVIIDAERNVFADSASGGTMKDWRIRELEIRAFEKHIKGEDRVLDVGCGNGFATVQLARRTGCRITGIDYSAGMIENARELLAAHFPDLAGKIDYKVRDVLNMDAQTSDVYDVVITERCLINLIDWDSQKKAIEEISGVLPVGGSLLMIEGSVQGLNNLNQARAGMNLSAIKSPWHNQFIDDNLLLDYMSGSFEIIVVDNFCSMYMLISRALHPKLVEPDSPSYGAKINDFAMHMPNSGDFGYLKLFAFKKAKR